MVLAVRSGHMLQGGQVGGGGVRERIAGGSDWRKVRECCVEREGGRGRVKGGKWNRREWLGR